MIVDNNIYTYSYDFEWLSSPSAHDYMIIRESRGAHVRMSIGRENTYERNL